MRVQQALNLHEQARAIGSATWSGSSGFGIRKLLRQMGVKRETERRATDRALLSLGLALSLLELELETASVKIFPGSRISECRYFSRSIDCLLSMLCLNRGHSTYVNMESHGHAPAENSNTGRGRVPESCCSNCTSPSDGRRISPAGSGGLGPPAGQLGAASYLYVCSQSRLRPTSM